MVREPSLLEQVMAVARRSAAGAFRQRALLFFPMLFPLILFAINGSAISKLTEIPGFPTSSYRAFLLAMPFIQGAMFVSINAGTSLARDVETGFLNRLALTPLRSEAMLVGQLGGAFVLGCVQAVVYLLVGLASRRRVRKRRRRRARAARPVAFDLVRLRLPGRSARAAPRQRRSDPGDLPAAVRDPLPELGDDPAQPDQSGMVPRSRHLQPGLLPHRGACAAS